MSAADHTDNARTYLRRADGISGGAELNIARAQVEATLAVAEALLELKDDGLRVRTRPSGIGIG